MCILARPATCMSAEHRRRQYCMTRKFLTDHDMCSTMCTHMHICSPDNLLTLSWQAVLLTAVTMHDARDKRQLISCYCADGVIHNRSYAHMAELTRMQCSTAVVLLQLCHVCIAPANAHCYRYLCVRDCSGRTRKACSVPHI